VDAVAQVRSLERCADTEYLLAASPPPEDPAVAARVQELEDELVRARALYAAGRYKEARAIADDVAVKADATGYLPLVSRAHLRLALSNTELDDREAARDAARTSFMAGLASGDDETAAQAASMFLWTAAEEGDKDTVE